MYRAIQREVRTGLPMGNEVKRCRTRQTKGGAEIKVGMRHDGLGHLWRMGQGCPGFPFILCMPYGKRPGLKA